MWKFLSAVATVLSFVSAFYLWGKVRHRLEEDPYYHYGDSLYRGDRGDGVTFRSPEEAELAEAMEKSGEGAFAASMIH